MVQRRSKNDFLQMTILVVVTMLLDLRIIYQSPVILLHKLVHVASTVATTSFAAGPTIMIRKAK